MKKKFKHEMGAQVQDTVTGVAGTITGRFEYLNGCKRYMLETIMGSDLKELVFDEDRLKVLTAPGDIVTSPTGGPQGSTPPPRTGAQS